jgi:saccharopine dehydrogenase-like NADP-dependent oxidoreductase
MGTAIAYGMDKLGFHVTGMDTNPEAANNMPQKVNLIDGETPRNEFFIVENAEDICRGIEAQVKPDIVISSLPYHQTEIVGKYCVDNGVRYCDLGGRVDVSQNINDHAKQHATKPVFTDLGLAPGLVNILAEQGYKEVLGGERGDIHVEMMVGGLPDYHESVDNPLRYKVTWSVDGLINEYRDDCIVLEDGEIKTVKGMSGVETFETESLGKVEAFYTSGGASHSIHSMKNRGVTNCSYKTIRYKGHGDMVRFLIRNCNLDDETLNKVFNDGCGHANKDEVIVIAKVKKANKTWRKEKLIKSDDQFSAMQKATAFSICSVASIMANGEMEGNKEQHRDYWDKYNAALSYADVPFDKFHSNLNKLGIDI